MEGGVEDGVGERELASYTRTAPGDGGMGEGGGGGRDSGRELARCTRAAQGDGGWRGWRTGWERGEKTTVGNIPYLLKFQTLSTGY